MTDENPLDMVPDATESNELADHLVSTIDVLAEDIGAAETPDAGGMAGMMGPDMALNVIRPLARRWAVESPDDVLASLARLHLETEALLNHHAPETDPEDLLDR